MTYVIILMTIGSGIRVIFRILPQNWRDYSVDITDERDL
jgi:hypothetical protein